MLLKPSPRKVSVRPGEGAVVRPDGLQVGEDWEAWNDGVSVFITGTASGRGQGLEHGPAQRPPRRSPSGPAGDKTRATSSIASPWSRRVVGRRRPAGGRRVGDPDGERHPGPQRLLVEQHRDRPRPGQRLPAKLSFFIRSPGRGWPPARRATRSSSRRKCLVTSWPPRGSRAARR